MLRDPAAGSSVVVPLAHCHERRAGGNLLPMDVRAMCSAGSSRAESNKTSLNDVFGNSFSTNAPHYFDVVKFVKIAMKQISAC